MVQVKVDPGFHAHLVFFLEACPDNGGGLRRSLHRAAASSRGCRVQLGVADPPAGENRVRHVRFCVLRQAREALARGFVKS